MPLRLIDRFHPSLRQQQQVAIDNGHLRKRDELELLEPASLAPLARLSLLLLLVGGLFFFVLNGAAYLWSARSPALHLTFWDILGWLVLNVLGALLILPIHELIHGLVFLVWGGRPYFGAKLPLALYCGAKEQLFRRNQYLVVGLAPLVVLSLLAIILTLFAPVLASYTLFASLSNVSGAAGDVWVAYRLAHQPAHVLVEDTNVGYRVWEVL